MLKREWGVESNGKLPHLHIPSKTATFVPEFSVEELSFGRTATLDPVFVVKDLPWAQHSVDIDDIKIIHSVNYEGHPQSKFPTRPSFIKPFIT